MGHDDKSSIILSNMINAKCALKDMLLFYSGLLKDDIAELENARALIEDAGKNVVKEEITLPSTPLTANDEDSIDNYINHLSNLLKKAEDLKGLNKNLQEDVESKATRITYLEYRLRKSEEEHSSFNSNINDRNTIIEELKSKLDDAEKKASALDSANLMLNQQIDTLLKENSNLQVSIEEEGKKKKQLNHIIKSAINSMKF